MSTVYGEFCRRYKRAPDLDDPDSAGRLIVFGLAAAALREDGWECGREKAGDELGGSSREAFELWPYYGPEEDSSCQPSEAGPKAPGVCILGVDPGLAGAVAFYFPAHPELIAVEDMPVVAGEIDAATLAARIRQMAPDFAIVERAAARPKQGVSSVFKFGSSYGAVLGVIGALAIPSQLVWPCKWKKRFGLGADKEKARALALRLWPARAELFERKRDHGRAEAALLARYGAEFFLNEGSLPNVAE
ncbi:RuvC family protein [Methylocystis suflitae]|uniref:hypothetical protein n=1 Tax=Methylocystis suflitae TaxID=2951405 RepID=UPI00210AD2D4|nr:hypothetical protein [Methylocystis suflitae]MCQ4188856.1 hypothetical protein [Methylocystis suflitae]